MVVGVFSNDPSNRLTILVTASRLDSTVFTGKKVKTPFVCSNVSFNHSR